MFHLGYFLGNGLSVHRWPPTEEDRTYAWNRPRLYQDMAQLLERAAVELLVIEDTSMVPDAYQGSGKRYLERGSHAPKLDPAPMVPYIAAATNRIGIVPTFVTTYYPPYLLARMLATLDHLTDGRIGWNIVTGTSLLSAQNYGLREMPPHDERYDIADEFVELCQRLWASWEPDAVIDDPDGIFADHTKVHRVDFEGRYFSSRGPLNVPPSPQLRPVFCQAGASPRGREFAARHAEIVIGGGHSPAAMKAHRDDIHARMAKYGRTPDQVKVLFSCYPIVGRTTAEATAKRDQRAEPTDDKIHERLAVTSLLSGVDLGQFDLDEPLPDVTAVGNESIIGYYLAQDPRPTPRQIAIHTIEQMAGTYVGTPSEVADQMEAVMDDVGGDGFLVTGPFRPDYVHDLVDLLAPELHRRGLVPSSYRYPTLRQNLLSY